jgi:hypothetical protein
LELLLQLSNELILLLELLLMVLHSFPQIIVHQMSGQYRNREFFVTLRAKKLNDGFLIHSIFFLVILIQSTKIVKVKTGEPYFFFFSFPDREGLWLRLAQ